jgi:hypothetical protein
VTFDLGSGLLHSGAVTPDELARALVVTLEPGMPLARALVGLGLVSEEDLQRELTQADRSPALTEVHPRVDLVAMLPAGLCNRLAALPVDLAPDGTVEVAVLDPRDRHIAAELAYHLQRPVRLVRAPYATVREALVRSVTAPALPAAGRRQERHRAVSQTPAWGTPRMTPPPSAPYASRPVAAVARIPPPVMASVTSSTRRFFVGMRSAASDRPPAPPPAAGLPASDDPRVHVHTPAQRRGPNMTMQEIEPPTRRMRDAPAFPLLAALPKVLPPLAPPQPPPEHFPDPAATLGQLRAATSRDEVLFLVEKSARAVATRVALFVYRKDALVGWSCSPEFGAVQELRSVSIAVHSPSLLDTVLAGGVYLGPLMGSVGAAILRMMRTATRDVAIVAIHVAGKPAVVILCDELYDTLLATRHLDVLAKVAGEGLARVIRARRG